MENELPNSGNDGMTRDEAIEAARMAGYRVRVQERRAKAPPKRYPFPMMDVARYVDLHFAHELGVRLSELHTVMQIVESCGASLELTEAVNRLGERMRQVQADLESACKAAMGQ